VTPWSFEVVWDNRPEPTQGVVLRQRVYGNAGAFWLETRIGPRGLLNLSQAALLLRVSRPMIYHWITDGRLKALRARGRPFVPLAEIKKLKLERSIPKAGWGPDAPTRRNPPSRTRAPRRRTRRIEDPDRRSRKKGYRTRLTA
jgi:excisionase family DNA binding protein